MSNCATTPARKATCPVNGQRYSSVSITTILHQVNKPWNLDLPDQGYYFCDDPNCDVVYFGENQLTLVRDDLRYTVGQKTSSDDRTICYCFDVKSSDLDSESVREKSRAFVVEKTKSGACSCEYRNPSGKCCLKDFN